MRLRRSDNQFGDLERQLRAQRAVPSDRLQDNVSELTSRRLRRRGLRLAVTVAVTMLVTAALLGTASRAGNGGSTVKQGSAPHAQKAQPGSSASEYGEKVIICHRTSRRDKGQTLRLSRVVAKLHLRLHRWDTAGPCLR